MTDQEGRGMRTRFGPRAEDAHREQDIAAGRDPESHDLGKLSDNQANEPDERDTGARAPAGNSVDAGDPEQQGSETGGEDLSVISDQDIPGEPG